MQIILLMDINNNVTQEIQLVQGEEVEMQGANVEDAFCTFNLVTGTLLCLSSVHVGLIYTTLQHLFFLSLTSIQFKLPFI